LAAVGILSGGPLAAQGAPQAKPIALYVPAGPGGGYDIYARAFARYFAKHLPGKPDYVVKNMPGAGSAKVANYIHNVAPKDGTQLGMLMASLAFDPLFGGELTSAMSYSPIEFNWLGSLDQFTPIAVAWHTTGITSIEDIKKKDFYVGSTGGSNPSNMYGAMLNGMIGTKFKTLAGYPGTQEITLAVERGELSGMLGWYWAGLKALKPDWVAQKKINVLLQLGLDRDPDLPGVPHVLDVLTNDQDKRLFKLVLSNLALARPFVAPPGVPAERVKVLRDTFNTAAADPAFLAEMAAAKQPVRVYRGEQIETLLKQVYASPPELIARVRKVAKQK
jgi:tripartite-type tricarboxylate transporter receptor subunit TctC